MRDGKHSSRCRLELRNEFCHQDRFAKVAHKKLDYHHQHRYQSRILQVANMSQQQVSAKKQQGKHSKLFLKHLADYFHQSFKSNTPTTKTRSKPLRRKSATWNKKPKNTSESNNSLRTTHSAFPPNHVILAVSHRQWQALASIFNKFLSQLNSPSPPPVRLPIPDSLPNANARFSSYLQKRCSARHSNIA